MQLAGSNSKARWPRPLLMVWYSKSSCGAIKVQSSSARCKVEAIPSARWAVFRSRETTASWPSRVPSFKVANFMGGICQMQAIGANQTPKSREFPAFINRKGSGQQRQLLWCQITPLAFGDAQRFQGQATDGGTVQGAAMVAGGSQHALDLVVFTLLQHDFQLVLAALDASDGSQRRRLVVQLHASQQQRYQFNGYGLLRGGLVDLRHM